jgi:hypothetical protein
MLKVYVSLIGVTVLVGLGLWFQDLNIESQQTQGEEISDFSVKLVKNKVDPSITGAFVLIPANNMPR